MASLNPQRKLKIFNVTMKWTDIIKRKTLKTGEMPRMVKKFYKWFCKQRLKNLPVTSEIMEIKAKSLNADLNENEVFCK